MALTPREPRVDSDCREAPPKDSLSKESMLR